MKRERGVTDKIQCLKKYGALSKWQVVCFLSSIRHMRVRYGLDVGQMTWSQITKHLYLARGLGSRYLNRRMM